MSMDVDSVIYKQPHLVPTEDDGPSTPPTPPTPPGTWIVWMLGQAEEGDPSVVDDQARDIAEAGFVGVVLTPRAGRLDLRSPDMLGLLSRATSAARANGLDVWCMADPRLASDSLIRETGEASEVLIVNARPDEQWDGDNLNTARIENGRFTWTMEYPCYRSCHIHPAGAITYTPVGVERVYACRRSPDGIIKEVRNITPSCQWFHDIPGRRVEVFGDLGRDLDDWEIIAFPRFRTNLFDYAGHAVWVRWKEFIEELLGQVDGVSGIAWDEPGFYTEFGQFPAGGRIREHFRILNGYELNDELAWLVLDAPDGHHIRVRNDFYRCLNTIIARSLRRNRAFARKGRSSVGPIHSGIHATWHGEFGGMEDMSHGSLDLWCIRAGQTAAFVDVGAAERLADPGGAPDVIYSLVLARSLARVGPNAGVVYCNLWGNQFGTPDAVAPIDVMDYWRWLLDLFSARWLAHAYGYTGTRSEDRGFGPGYPEHPSWSRWPMLNSHAREKGTELEKGEPIGDVLLVFPLESFYALGHLGANRFAAQLVKLVDSLTRRGYQLDIVSPDWLADASVKPGELALNTCEYRSLLLPYCRVMSGDAWEVVLRASEEGIPVIADLPSSAVNDPAGRPLSALDRYTPFNLLSDPLETIAAVLDPTFELPQGSIGTVRRVKDGYQVHLIPDRPGGRFGGVFRFKEKGLEVQETGKPFTRLLPAD